MSISSCPACSKQVTIPSGLGTTAKVRCPLCHSQYTLADALVNMPPLLELVDDAGADWPELPNEPEAGLAADATLDYLPELASDSEPADEPPVGAGESGANLVADVEPDEFSSEEKDTEIEELGFIAAEPLVRQAPADDDPLEMAGPDEGSVLDFEPEPDAEAGEAGFDSTPAEEEIALDFDEITPVEEAVAFEADATGEQTVEGEELVFDLAESESAEAPAAADFDEAADLGEPVVETNAAADGADEIELDFGEPVTAESEAAAPAADAPADDEAPADDDPKGKKKKKKKSREPKAPAEPGRRRSLSSVLGVLLAAIVALPLTLYGVLWINPDYDFFKIGSILPKAMLPAAMSRPKYVAAKPAIPLQPGSLPQLPQRQPAQPPAETEPPAEPAAAGPSLDADKDAPPPADSDLPQPAPAADQPAEPAPDDSPPVQPLADKRPSADAPEEMPEKPAAPPADDPANGLPAPAADKPNAPAKPDDAPSPFDDARPSEPAAAPESTDVPGPAGAAEFTVADLAKAMDVAQAADEKMIAAQATDDTAELKKVRSNFYLSVFRLAEAATFVKDDAAAGQLDELRHELEQVVEQFATDAKRVDALKFNAARWLDYSKRTTSGIVLAGNVVSAQRVGKLHEIKLGIGLESDAPIVTVLSAKDPALSAGDRAFVLGGIVENPAEQLAGYQGNEATVVWGGLFVKAPADK